MKKWEDYGESSLTLLAVYCSMDKESPTTPLDPSDFRRCIHLFECLDLGERGIFKLLYQAAGKYPAWKPFAEEWDTLTSLYNEEKDQDRAPKLYKAMLNIRKNDRSKKPTN
jgi:hypothetical protein